MVLRAQGMAEEFDAHQYDRATTHIGSASRLALAGAPSGHRYSVDFLGSALLADVGGLATRVRELLRGEIAVYRGMPAAVLDRELGRELAVVLRAVSGGEEAFTAESRAYLSSVGEQRARQGIPLDEVMRAGRVALNAMVGMALEVGQRLNIDNADVLAFVQSWLVWSDRVLVFVTRGHQGAARAVADEHQARFVRRVLLGGLSCAELAVEAEMHGLDPSREYVAIRARPGGADAGGDLLRALGLQESSECRRGLCADVDGHVAGFMTEAPPRDIDAVVGFGPPRPLQRLGESYRLALRALATAEACGMRGAHGMASLGLRPAIALDADVGQLLNERILQPLMSTNASGELIATLRAYLDCGMHVERTATRLFVHQNTVRYRLAKAEKLIGASLADVEVLFELWWALELSTMTTCPTAP